MDKNKENIRLDSVPLTSDVDGKESRSTEKFHPDSPSHVADVAIVESRSTENFCLDTISDVKSVTAMSISTENRKPSKVFIPVSNGNKEEQIHNENEDDSNHKNIIEKMKTCLQGNTWKYLMALVIPIILLPIPLVATTKEAKCGYGILIMAIYWMFELIPIEATSLLPIALFPLLGVLSTKEACIPYMNSTIMMFVGGLMMAVAIENCNLHRRIALNVLLRIKPTPPRIMFGFMMNTMFLSMWISNTASAAIMVPILDALLNEFELKSLAKFNQDDEMNIPPSTSNCTTINKTSIQNNLKLENSDGIIHRARTSISVPWPEKEVILKKNETLRKALFLGIAYASNIGGTGTLTGTGPNLVIKGLVDETFPESSDLSFDKWMMYNVPVMLICTILAICFLHFAYVRKASDRTTDEMVQSFRNIIRRKHAELGLMAFQEKAVITLFVILVILWISRDPKFVNGWSKLFSAKIKDATPAIGVSILMFLIPTDPRHFAQSPPLMTWKTLQAKMPWGIIMLLGGGFSLAEASKKSGLSVWISRELAAFEISSSFLVLCVLCLLTTMITEVTSNVATAQILLSVVGHLAVVTRVHPLYYMIPVTISCSFAFMLPVGTPPNAIVFTAGKMKILDMVKPGIFMNILCLTIEILMINSYGVLVFNFNQFPSWAKRNETKL